MRIGDHPSHCSHSNFPIMQQTMVYCTVCPLMVDRLTAQRSSHDAMFD